MKKFIELCKKLGTVFFRFPILSALLGCILLPMAVYFIASEIMYPWE